MTAFNLLDKFCKGIDVDSFLNAYVGFNALRIFLYTPVKDWGSNSWNIPSDFDQVKKFIEYVAGKGFRTELTLVTDDDVNKLQQVKALVSYLNQYDLPLMLEGVNEPLTHSKVDVKELKNALNGSRFLYSSGVYEDLKQFYGKYGTIHTSRDNEWPRKAKDALECYRGGGPNSPDEPACKVPWILDEPIRPDQSGYNVDDFYTYGALGSLVSAGITFHCLSAELTNLPSGDEDNCKNALLKGMNVFPNDAPLGNYDRFDDDSLRSYVIGNYLVRVRPRSVLSRSEWKPLDDKMICYGR